MLSSRDEAVGPLAVVSFIVNCCMGLGFLTIPYSVTMVGLVPALILLVVICLLASLTAVWCATILSFVSALLRSGVSVVCERAPLGLRRDTELQEGDFVITKNNLTYAMLVRLLLGHIVENCVLIMIVLCLFAGLWAYAGLVPASLTVMVPFFGFEKTCDVYHDWEDWNCRYHYWAYMSCFAAVVLLLSALQMKEQKWFQIFMTCMRALLVTCLLVDCIRMLSLNEAPPQPPKVQGHSTTLGSDNARYDPHNFPESLDPLHFSPAHLPGHVALVTAAIAVHIVIPDTVHDLEDKERNIIPTIATAMLFCGTVYFGVALLIPLTFGSFTHPVCNLNWVNYTGGQPTASGMALAFRYLVLVVPVLDVTAAFPLFVTSLSLTCRMAINSILDRPTDFKEPIPWWLRMLYAIPPILGAAFIPNISVALAWSGLFIGPLMFIVLPVLLLRAETFCCNHFGEHKTHCSVLWRWYCDRRLVWTVLILGTIFYIVGAISTLTITLGLV